MLPMWHAFPEKPAMHMAGFFMLTAKRVVCILDRLGQAERRSGGMLKPLLVIGFLPFVVYDYIKINIINQGNVHQSQCPSAAAVSPQYRKTQYHCSRLLFARQS